MKHINLKKLKIWKSNFSSSGNKLGYRPTENRLRRSNEYEWLTKNNSALDEGEPTATARVEPKLAGVNSIALNAEPRRLNEDTKEKKIN